MPRMLLVCVVLLCVAGRASAERPNIVFIFSDDHAVDAIGAYGGWLAEVDPTPRIDSLAKSGMLFRNSFCTNSLCGPSRAVILTGLHSHLNGFRENGDLFNPDQQTFPKLLQQAGYQTALFGKWHLRSDPQGFDTWRVVPGQGHYYDPDFLTPDGERERLKGYISDVITDLSLDWLKRRDDERPFMLMVQHKAPHRCWMPPLRHAQLYADRTLPEPPTLFDDFADNASPAAKHEMGIDAHMDEYYDLFLPKPPGWSHEAIETPDVSGRKNLARLDEDVQQAWNEAFAAENEAFTAGNYTGKQRVRAKYQRYVKNYLRSVRGVDDSVGRVLDYLAESGLADNTVVIYSSDQGFFLGEHGWYDKRWMYEPSLRMPLIVRWPGVTRPGSVCEALVQNLDYASTFLELAGAVIPDNLQGRSLVPLLRGQSPVNWRDAIYYHYYEYPAVHMAPKQRGVRTERFKLIHFYETDEWEFYDLDTDPHEMKNLYDDPRYAGPAARLKAKLAELRKKYRDE